MSKWEIFRSIEPECWIEERVSGGTIWRLTPEWTSQYYRDRYRTITRDGDPFQNTWRICRFEGVNQSEEITIYSFRAATPEYYDFEWTHANTAAGQWTISRFKRGQKSGSASLRPGNAPGTLTIHSPEIEEEFLVDLRTLRFTVAESRSERAQRIEPWQRMLTWYGKLRQFDVEAYQRVPLPIRGLLDSGAHPFLKMPGPMSPMRPPWITEGRGELTPELLAAWQKQKLMPEEMPWLWQNEIAGVVQSIQLLQQLVSDPRRLANPVYLPRVPQVLKSVNAMALDLLDLKALIAIGAIREVWGYKAREWHKLLGRRPELKALCQTPQGQAQVENDPEWQMILNHPLAIQEMDEEMEAQQHRKGDHGPTPKEKLRQGEIEIQRMFSSMRAQDAQINAMMGMYGVPAMAPMPAYDFSSPYLKEEPPPAWRVYRPYMI